MLELGYIVNQSQTLSLVQSSLGMTWGDVESGPPGSSHLSPQDIKVLFSTFRPRAQVYSGSPAFSKIP